MDEALMSALEAYQILRFSFFYPYDTGTNSVKIRMLNLDNTAILDADLMQYHREFKKNNFEHLELFNKAIHIKPDRTNCKCYGSKNSGSSGPRLFRRYLEAWQTWQTLHSSIIH